MTDEALIELYFDRNEEALRQTDAIYGGRLFVLADRILQERRDSEECVSDTYLKTWQTIPPQRPRSLFAYLAVICRNLALGRLDWYAAAKRNAVVVSLTAELEQCIPGRSRELERSELGQLLNGFLAGLTPESRRIFLRRYWFGDSVRDIARRFGVSESKVKTRLHRTRNALKHYLEREGIHL